LNIIVGGNISTKSLERAIMTESVMSKTVHSSDGLSIYAEAVGDPSKPHVVWIHGNSTSASVWDRQFDDPELRKKLHQVRFDLRGHGRSGTPDHNTQGPFDMERQADDVNTVLDAFGIVKVSISSRLALCLL
jgi:pimeloyl-ACP methyl ester carboxylesterase